MNEEYSFKYKWTCKNKLSTLEINKNFTSDSFENLFDNITDFLSNIIFEPENIIDYYKDQITKIEEDIETNKHVRWAYEQAKEREKSD